MDFNFNWGLLHTIISSSIIGGPIAIWKVIYPMYLRSVKIKLEVHDCWYRIFGGGATLERVRNGKTEVIKTEDHIHIYALVSVEQQRGENIQILRFRWNGIPTIGTPHTADGAGIQYTLYLSAGHLTKRDLEWEFERESQTILDDKSIPGEIVVEATRNKKATAKCCAVPKIPDWAKLWP